METPSLLLNVEQLEKNINTVSQFANKYNIAFRPHIKTHKSITIAKMQMDYGANGITVAKLEEAEIMARGGLKNIFIAYPITLANKVKRLKELKKNTNLIVSVDTIQGAEILNEAFWEDPIEVWIKINSGLNRCGVEPVEETVQLAKVIQSFKGLTLTGLYTHAGHAYGAKTEKELIQIAKQEVETVVESAKHCEAEGIPITHRSVGSTPTFMESGKMQGITEVRPGNAVFYDMNQVGLGVASVDDCSLTVLATVVSKQKNRLIIDTGSKALSLEQGAHGNKSVKGFGYIKSHPKLVIERLSEEHGIIPFKGEAPFDVNDTVEIIPNHACVVANLFNQYTVYQPSQGVVDYWKIDARGALE